MAKTLFKNTLNKLFYFLMTISLKKAVKEQNLKNLFNKLKSAIPDIKNQYSSYSIDTPYLETKVRSQHAFQISLVEKAIALLKQDKDEYSVVDIGDSSGTHIQYLSSLYPKKIRALSVNLDKKAVDKIRQKGLEAIHGRAEEIEKYNISTDIFLSFETLEHLTNPIGFLKKLAENTDCNCMVITVPYLKTSRIGLRYIRKALKQKTQAETTHIFELNPSDWKLLFKYAGWNPTFEKIYFQYPKISLLRALKHVWRTTDFEGFWGVILKKDDSWSKLYCDW